MIKSIILFLAAVSVLIIVPVLAADPFAYTNAPEETLAKNAEGIPTPERAPEEYYVIRYLAKRTLGCLCANTYPVGLGAGRASEITYRVLKNDRGQAVSVYALCIKQNKGWNKRVLGTITLPFTPNAQIQIGTPGDDRNNANAAVLREALKGAVIIPFRRQSYRISRCPANRDHYQSLNWSQPELWPEM